MTINLHRAVFPALTLCCLAPFADFTPSAADAQTIDARDPLAPLDPLAPIAAASVTIDLPPARSVDDLAPQTYGPSLASLVDTYSANRASTYAADCLARAVYFEARGEPLEGQLAVAQVVINRSRDPKFAGTICNVVREPAQFSFVRSGRIPNPNVGSDAWPKAVAIAHIALAGIKHSRVSDSLYYHATSVSPLWRNAFSRKAKIGRHIFYR